MHSPVIPPGTDPTAPRYEGVPRPSRLAAFGNRILAAIERLVARTSRYGDWPIFDNAQFPFASEIEDAWPAIRAELETVLVRHTELPNFQDLTPEVGNINCDNHWKTYFFYGYGIRCAENCKRCPETTRILDRIPGMKTAFFSILAPGKHIPAHTGPYKGVLRYHLGLIVPEPKERCRIRVADQFRFWEEGKSLIFDDTFEHEVWNETNGLRAVLFVDFARPCRFPGNLVNRLFLAIAGWLPQLRRAKRNYERWEAVFYH